MKILIVFEDTYGIADIFKTIKKTDLDKQFVAICEDVYCYSGACNVSVFKLNSKIKQIIKELRITDVLSVFDVDTVNGDNNIIRGDELRHLISRNRDVDVKQWFMPIVYNSETVMLHQFLKASKAENLDIIDIVSRWSVRKLHLNILQGLIRERHGDIDAKLVRKYLDIDLLQESYSFSIREEDACFRNWLLGNCSLELSFFQDENGVIDTLNKISKHMQDKLLNGFDIVYAGEKYKIDCTISNKEQVAVTVINKNVASKNMQDIAELSNAATCL